MESVQNQLIPLGQVEGQRDASQCQCIDDESGRMCSEPVLQGSSYCERHRCVYMLEDASRCPRHVVGAGHFCAAHRSDTSALEALADIEVLKVVTEQYRQDLREFWQRTSIYVTGHGALLTASAFIVSSTGDGIKHRLLLLVMSLVGFILALIWIPVSRKSRDWIQVWRAEVVRVDTRVDRHLSFHRELFTEPPDAGQARSAHSHPYGDDRIASRTWWRGPTGLTLALPWLFLVIWAGMCLYFAFLV